MITYVYECLTCKNEFEVSQRLSDDKLTENNCTKCGSIQPCRRIIKSSNFVLPSDGWASTGYSKNIDLLKERI